MTSSPRAKPDRESRLHLLGIIAVTVVMLVGGVLVRIFIAEPVPSATATPIAVVTATIPAEPTERP